MKGGIDCLGGERLAGIGENHAARREAADGLNLLAAALDQRGLARKADAHIRAELWRKLGQSGRVNKAGTRASDQPQSSGRIGGAAAETGCDGKTLREAEPAELQAWHVRAR